MRFLPGSASDSKEIHERQSTKTGSFFHVYENRLPSACLHFPFRENILPFVFKAYLAEKGAFAVL